jgi:hypothetical protein
MLDDAIATEITQVFSTRELARLAIYRSAVQAGFYNEDCLPLQHRPCASDYQEHSHGLGTHLD